MELDVGAVELSGAHADPRQVGRQVVEAGPARHRPGLGAVVVERQALVAGEEVDALEHGRVDAGDGRYEGDRLADLLDDAVVLADVAGAIGEREVPVLGVVQVGEAAVDQGADEVEGEPGALVAAQQQLWIGLPVAGRERHPVDQVSPVRRQRELALPLLGGRARLGVLPGEAPDPDDALLAAVHQHQAHLQDDLETVGNQRRAAVIEAFGAIAALQQEGIAFTAFSPLGAASYLDGPRLGFVQYQAEAKRLNALLSSRFGWLHETALCPGRDPR